MRIYRIAMVSLALGCARTPRTDLSKPPEPPSPPISTALERRAQQRANTAADALLDSLKRRLVGALQTGGPAAALQACATDAGPLTEAAQQSGIRVGRSSLRLRNPANSGPEWVKDWLDAQGERPTAEAAGFSRIDTLPDGGRVARVVRPIAVGGPCLLCHGPAESLPPDVRQALTERYPDDAATGYAVGDLRGALWAEAEITPGLEMFGSLRSVMHEADYSEKVALQPLIEAGAGHGVGALTGLAGEITFSNGEAWITTPDGAGLRTTRLANGDATDLGAALLVFTQVSAWTEHTVTTPLDLESLGAAVRDAAAASGLSLDEPVPFRVEGALHSLQFHVIDGDALGAGPSSHAQHRDAARTVSHDTAEGTLIGLWSTAHGGVFTHMGATTHVHVTLEEPLGSGHVDGVLIPAGGRLFLPSR